MGDALSKKGVSSSLLPLLTRLSELPVPGAFTTGAQARTEGTLLVCFAQHTCDEVGSMRKGSLA